MVVSNHKNDGNRYFVAKYGQIFSLDISFIHAIQIMLLLLILKEPLLA